MASYPTGVSAQPLDLGSIASNYMKSAVEQKLYEIQQNKAEVGGNAERLLKAMSVQAIPELSGKLRDDMNKKIEDYRSDMVNRFRAKEGKLGFEDRVAIEKGANDLMNEMNVKKNWISKYGAVQQLLYNPNAKKAYDVAGAISELEKAHTDFMSGKVMDDPGLIPFKHVLPEDYTGAIIEDQRKNLSLMGKKSDTTIAGGTQTTVEDVPIEVRRARAEAYVNSEPMFANLSEERKQAEVQKALDSFNPSEVTKKPYIPRRTGSGGGGMSKDAQDFTPTPTMIGNSEYNLVNTPTTITQTPRTYIIKGGTNVTTGEKGVDIPKDAEVIGVDVEKNKIIYQGKGGEAQQNGETVYFKEGTTPTLNDGKWMGGFTKENINNPTVREKQLALQAPDADKIENTRVEPIEGGYQIIGEAVTSNWGKKSRKTVSVTFKTGKDPKAEAVYESSLYDNRPVVANWMNKVAINGKPLSTYFDNPPKQETKVITTTRQELLGRGYSEAQIEQFVKDGKVKLQ